MTGEPLKQRSDDNPAALKKRLEAYHRQTQPLVQYYAKQKLHMQVDATKSPDAIFSAICNIFEAIKEKDNVSAVAAKNWVIIVSDRVHCDPVQW